MPENYITERRKPCEIPNEIEVYTGAAGPRRHVQSD